MYKKILKVLFLLILSTSVLPQKKIDIIRSEAIRQMNIGKYGEAIDLLNKVVSAYPQEWEGYNLRGLCYEKRDQLTEAVFDFRAARKIAPNNSEVAKNLARATKNWYDQLYLKIEGHRREIAINPAKPINYLEIGKCYKHLGQWTTAEEWYDQYLKREEGSADEIIRYTEILARNNHIEKGEKILKIYVARYPEDHRLWSRYGYFTLWLGKKKIALEAFETALSFRPYFKEAMDGYDLARDKGYTYTYFDTTYRKWESQAKLKAPEYIIDKYYRILKTKQDDDETRFALVNELIKTNRWEEASQQLQILQKNHADNPKFIKLSDTVTLEKENYNKLKIEEYAQKVKSNPNDQEAVLQLAQYYANLLDYDNAVIILENYLKNSSNKDVSTVRFRLAQVSAWNYQWENAIAQLNILMANDSSNIDYQLLRGRIAAWMVQDLEEGKVWLGNVLKKEPQNMEAIVSLVTVYTWDRDFSKAQEYLNLAEQIDPNSKELETVKNLYNSHLAADEERKIFSIRGEAGKLSGEGNFQGALEKYDEYLSKISGPNKQELIEYADLHKSLNNFPKAIEIYNKLLDEEYDPQVALLRGTACLWNGDSISALTEFQKLVKENPEDFQANFYLAQGYEAVHEYDSARTIYDSLLVKSTDSSEIKLVQQRISWMPVSGFISFFDNLSTYVRVSPQAIYFADNQNLKYYNIGGSIDVGLLPFLSTDVTLFRGNLKSNLISQNFTTFKWHLNYNFLYKFYVSAGSGSLTYQGQKNRRVYDASLRLMKKDVYSVYTSYENTDAVLILFSPKLLTMVPRISCEFYRITGNYQFKSKLTISGSYRYISLSDGNKGNDLQFRIGKPFAQEIVGGYEYGYAQYAWNSKDYYSPQNNESHSIWAELKVLEEGDYTFSLSGNIGYVPSIDFIIRGISAAASYKPTESLLISGGTSLSHSYRFDMNYRSVSAFLSIYWSF